MLPVPRPIVIGESKCATAFLVDELFLPSDPVAARFALPVDFSIRQEIGAFSGYHGGRPGVGREIDTVLAFEPDDGLAAYGRSGEFARSVQDIFVRCRLHRIARRVGLPDNF